jgi:hypothetical protein
MSNQKPLNISAYVSQKNWKDSDPEVECTVECLIDGILHKAVFYSICPMTAIDKVHKNFSTINWMPKE